VVDGNVFVSLPLFRSPRGVDFALPLDFALGALLAATGGGDAGRAVDFVSALDGKRFCCVRSFSLVKRGGLAATTLSSRLSTLMPGSRAALIAFGALLALLN
jgi:hypothetical protein